MKIVMLTLLFWLVLIFSGVWAKIPAESTKPNVVLILIDDLSHYGITAYGAIKSVPC